MSSKQKIAISAIGIVLVLAIIGLTIGLVLVASTATGTSSMKVTYVANNVKCSIAAAGVHYETVSSKEGDTIALKEGSTSPISIDATATDGKMGALAFADQPLTANSEAVYTFTITNNATQGADAKAITVKTDLTGTSGNITVKIGNTRDTATEVATHTISSIAAGESATVVVRLKVKDPSIGAELDQSITMTITQVAGA